MEPPGGTFENTQQEVLFYTTHDNLCNKLPQNIVEANSVASFKRGLDQFMENRSVKDVTLGLGHVSI